VGGVVICVRANVDYFDVKFPDSVHGWCRRWLYIHEEDVDSQEYNIAPFDGAAKILWRRSWDAEVTDEEKTAMDALMKCIHELQNTRGKELSGVQITAHFLRIRVQPLQARKNPLWSYSGEKDVDRISKDLSVKDLEKFIRRFSSLSKKDGVPTSCRVEPYSGSHALPEVSNFVFRIVLLFFDCFFICFAYSPRPRFFILQNHQILSSLPPLPEGGEVDERTVVTDNSQEPSLPESEATESQKSAGSSKKETVSEQYSESGHSISPPLATSPDGRKRKRNDIENSGTSKLAETAAEESSPEEEGAFDPFADAGDVSS
jgi:hypothetical protein